MILYIHFQPITKTTTLTLKHSKKTESGEQRCQNEERHDQHEEACFLCGYGRLQITCA